VSLPLIVVGAGGHAKVCIDALRLAGRDVKGILTPEEPLWGKAVQGVPVLGDDDRIDGYVPSEVEVVNGIGSTGDPSRRIQIYMAMKNKGFRFAVVIHPSAIISNDAFLGEGAQVMAGAVIQFGCRIGDNVIVNTGAIVDHDCHIGDHAHLATGAILSGGVRVGTKSHIGTGASVVHGITIGESVLVAAGSVVVRGIPPNVQVRGVPAEIVGQSEAWRK
jgi:sugar O-acyltransferase (sialic acid O-acetyltransferase NeuD family)